MTRHLRTYFALLAVALSGRITAGDNPLRIALVSEVKTIAPGKPFYVALHLQHQPGDHTYWKFPGVVGVPTGMEWKLPEGFKAGPIEWPEPQKVLMFQIKAQGYEGEVLLPMQITPPKDLRAGRKITLSGQATWMCCGRTCHPGVKDLSLDLMVAADAPLDQNWHGKFELARASRPAELAGWEAHARRAGGEITLTLTASDDVARERARLIKDVLFFSEDGLVNVDKPQAFSKPAADMIELKLAVSEYTTDPQATELIGVVQTQEGWNKDGTVKSAIVRVKISE